MASDGAGASTQALLRFRPHLWQVAAGLVMAVGFGSVWYAATVLFAPVDMSCQRRAGGVDCDVTTQRWPNPSVAHYSEQVMADASLELVPQQYDHSYRQLVLVGRRGRSSTLLLDFTTDLRASEVEAINDYLEEPSEARISRRIVASTENRTGRLFMLLMCAGSLAIAGVALARRTAIAFGAGRLRVRRSRWPFKPDVRELELGKVTEVAAVSRIPESLAQTVAALPWRNIYRANALAARLADGEEVMLTDWCKRSLALHQRLAAALNSKR